MNFQKKRILITVKAYPNPSKRYGETVCCAGIDLETSQWIRLFPIPYRDLDYDQRFKKYSIIDAECAPAPDDKRPESFKVRASSITIVEWIDTERGKWDKRKSIVLQLPVKSLCQVYRDVEEKDLSLGLIKPESISFEWEKQSKSDKLAKTACYSQLSFYDKKKDEIEEIPFNFYYSFKCATEECCPGHKLSIIDWEIGQAYRDWRFRYPKEDVLFEKLEQRWLDMADATKNDVFFYVGNMKRFRNTFMVLGVFYPRKSSSS